VDNQVLQVLQVQVDQLVLLAYLNHQVQAEQADLLVQAVHPVQAG
jgi:hypothetical protein